MGAKKGGKSKREKDRPKVHQSYTVVNQSYEDKEYVDRPKPVLVPSKTLENRHKKKNLGPVMRFGDDIPEDYRTKRNMLMEDDTVEDELFDDEVEEDFGNEFIQQMMKQPAPGDGEDEDEEDDEFQDEAKAYPRHDTSRRAIDKAFEREMEEFELDEELDEDDPRAHGTMDVMAYSSHLQQFVSEHAGDSYFNELPLKHRALLNHLRFRADNNAVFDSDDKGYFMTVLPDKRDGNRIAEQFQKDSQAMKEWTLSAVKSGKLVVKDALDEDETDGLEATAAKKKQEMEGGGAIVVEIPRPKEERFDCETILSTYSTLYNHPNVVAASRKKLDLQRAARNKPQKQPAENNDGSSSTKKSAVANASFTSDDSAKRQRGADRSSSSAAAAAQKQQQEEKDSDYDEDEDDDIEYVDRTMLSERDKDETPEEKRMRRHMVKEYQRERRQQKKLLKQEYRTVHIERSNVAPKSKKDKATMKLSVVRAHVS